MRRGTIAAVAALVFLIVCLLAPGAVWAQQQGPKVHWIKGPRTVDLGRVAQLDLPAGYIFLNAADTRTLQDAMGNVPDGHEVGLVAPAARDENWFVIFDYDEVGHIKDDEKDKIDASAILEGIRKGTEEANKVRAKKGISAIHVTGWQQPPTYESVTHNLTWAIIGQDDDGSRIVNFNVRLLGRKGYISATLVEDATKILAARPHLDRILAAFSYKPGNRYAEFRPGDKLAQYGLVALVAGGAGAVAAKTGLLAALFKVLAKGGKAIVLLVVGAVAGLVRVLKKLFQNETRY
jgi:uncharacterized membrane-anchored protein